MRIGHLSTLKKKQKTENTRLSNTMLDHALKRTWERQNIKSLIFEYQHVKM